MVPMQQQSLSPTGDGGDDERRRLQLEKGPSTGDDLDETITQ